MRTRHANIALFALLPLCGCARAPDSEGIVGHYTRRIAARDNPDWRGMVGDWDIQFGADGVATTRNSGWNGMQIKYAYHLDGGVLTVNDVEGPDGSCRSYGVDSASGIYRVHFIASGFEVTPLHDECTSRRFAMSVHPFRRVR